MSVGGGVMLIIAGVVVASLAILQILQYRRGAQLISATQLALRLLVALIVIATIVGIFVGLLTFSSAAQVRGREYEFIAYWALLLAAIVTVAALALVDYRLARSASHRAQAEVYRQMSELQEIIARAEGNGVSKPARGEGPEKGRSGSDRQGQA